MKDDLLYGYYERELEFARKLAAEFAERYPAVAGRLLLEQNQSQDPHVERLIQAFAFVAARIQLRLDDDYPEFADALLSILYPHALTPLPSTTIVQFDLDPQQGRLQQGVTVPAQTTLLSKKIDDVPCRFRTVYPVQLWPLVLEHAELVPATRTETMLVPDAQAALLLRFRTASGEPLSEYALSTLRLHLDGEPGIVHALYEALFRAPLGAILRTGKEGGIRLPKGCVREVGFGPGEGLYDEPRTGMLGYRLLQEYFAFPEKFLFADLVGLEPLRKAGDARSFEVLILLPEADSRLEGRVSARNFQLGCTPAVNLFPLEASPIRMTGRQVEYRVVPDHRAPMHYEVHSVLDVAATRPGVVGMREFRPFFALRHGDERDGAQAFFHVRREQSLRQGDFGTDVWLTLVDEDYRPVELDKVEVLHVTTLCTNRDLPVQVVFGDPAGDFLLEGQAAIRRTRALRQATKVVRPHLHGQSRWRLVSHLSLNHLSLVGDGKGGEAAALQAFRELLRLYDGGETAATRQRIEGLVGVSGRRVTRLLPGVGAVRGIGVELVFDEARFAGSGVFLFASVLERFLGLFASVNSFTQTSVRVLQREGVQAAFAPRAGERSLS